MHSTPIPNIPQDVALGASPQASQPSPLAAAAAAAAAHLPAGWPPGQQPFYPQLPLQAQPIQPQLLHPSVAALRGGGVGAAASGGSRRCFSAPTSPRAASTGGTGGSSGRRADSPQALIRVGGQGWVLLVAQQGSAGESRMLPRQSWAPRHSCPANPGCLARACLPPPHTLQLPPGSRLVLAGVEIEAMGSDDCGPCGMAGLGSGMGSGPGSGMPALFGTTVPPNSPAEGGFAAAPALQAMPAAPALPTDPPFPGWPDPAALAAAAAAAEMAAMQHQLAAAAAAWPAGGVPLLHPHAASAGLPATGFGPAAPLPAAPPAFPAASYTSACSPEAAAGAASEAAAAEPPPQHFHGRLHHQQQKQGERQPMRRPSSHQLPCMPNLGSAAALNPATLTAAALGDAAMPVPLGDAGTGGAGQLPTGSAFAAAPPEQRAAAGGGAAGPLREPACCCRAARCPWSEIWRCLPRAAS